MMSRTSKGEEFWAQHIKALRSSGQTSVAYARAHDLSVQALGWWRRKLHPALPKKSSRVEVAPKASKFVALKVSEPALPRSMPVTMTLGSEVHLQMSDLPPPAWLAEVIQSMRRVR